MTPSGAERARDPASGRPFDIAVVGGGIAGLAAAWMLAQRHRVTLFERQPALGFTAAGVAVHGQRADVPLRVFYPGYYPTLVRLYAALGVATEPVNYATSFSGADGQPYFRWRNLRLGDRSWPWMAPQDLLGARARRIAFGALHLQRRPASASATSSPPKASRPTVSKACCGRRWPPSPPAPRPMRARCRPPWWRPTGAPASRATACGAP